MELHFELKATDTKLTLPSAATALGHSEEICEDVGGEIAQFRDNLQSTKHVLFAVWPEPPRQRAYLDARSLEGQPRHTELKDRQVASTVAVRTSRKLRLIEPREEAPPKSNQKNQKNQENG